MSFALTKLNCLQQSYQSNKHYWRTWRDEHPQYRQLFSGIQNTWNELFMHEINLNASAEEDNVSAKVQ
uniref:Uncharacterized protein n=1 Tax=Wuchereria bancrofti TaxID=6293 RepID=A0AAF5PSB0_WUCBA